MTIVLAMGLTRGWRSALAGAAAALVALAGFTAVVGYALATWLPRSAVPENTLKYAVGLLLVTYGTFWGVEGMGLLHGGASLEWPGGDVTLLVILAGWLLLSRVLVAVLPRLRRSAPEREPKGAAV